MTAEERNRCFPIPCDAPTHEEHMAGVGMAVAYRVLAEKLEQDAEDNAARTLAMRLLRESHAAAQAAILGRSPGR